MKTTLMLMMSLFLVTFSVCGCESEGPAERLGEQIDETTENIGDDIRKAGESIEEATDNKN